MLQMVLWQVHALTFHMNSEAAVVKDLSKLGKQFLAIILFYQIGMLVKMLLFYTHCCYHRGVIKILIFL